MCSYFNLWVSKSTAFLFQRPCGFRDISKMYRYNTSQVTERRECVCSVVVVLTADVTVLHSTPGYAETREETQREKKRSASPPAALHDEDDAAVLCMLLGAGCVLLLVNPRVLSFFC